MKIQAPLQIAFGAAAANPGRPTATTVHDSPDARLIVFRIEPGQRVPPHTSTSTVILTVISGSGLVTGGAETQPVVTRDVIAYEPGELHGMEATGQTLVILATIAPRPGNR